MPTPAPTAAKTPLPLAPLLRALLLAAPALGGSVNVLRPALTHFRFMDDAICAFNDLLAIVVNVPSTGINLGLHGETLLGLLKASRGDTVQITVNGAVATLSGAGRVNIPVMGAEAFTLTFPEAEPLISLPINAEFIRALRICSLTVADSPLHPEYCGVTLRVDRGAVTLFSSDNETATRIVVKGAQVITRKTVAVVLPQSTCAQLLRLHGTVCDEKTPAQLHISEQTVVAEFGGEPTVTMLSKLIGTPSSKFADIFAQHTANAAWVPLPDGLQNEITKAQVLCAREPLKECTIHTTPGKLTLNVSTQLGKMASTLQCDIKTTGALAVNPDHLARMLPYATRFTLNAERSLVLEGEGELTHLISSVPRRQPAATTDPAATPPKRRPTGASGVDDDDIPF